METMDALITAERARLEAAAARVRAQLDALAEVEAAVGDYVALTGGGAAEPAGHPDSGEDARDGRYLDAPDLESEAPVPPIQACASEADIGPGADAGDRFLDMLRTIPGPPEDADCCHAEGAPARDVASCRETRHVLRLLAAAPPTRRTALAPPRSLGGGHRRARTGLRRLSQPWIAASSAPLRSRRRAAGRGALAELWGADHAGRRELLGHGACWVRDTSDVP